jgi:hypothetical protein
MEYLILWHLSSRMCARLKKYIYFTCTYIYLAFRKYRENKNFFLQVENIYHFQ